MWFQSWLNAAWVLVLLSMLPGCSQPQPSEDKRPKTEIVTASPDERYRQLVVGTWTDNYKGRRTLSVRPDGTATMVVEPKGLAAKLYAATMTFEEEWTIQDGRLKMKAVGGEPKARVDLILKMMGNLSDQKILELSGERMLLLDADGKTKFDWKRVPLQNSIGQ